MISAEELDLIAGVEHPDPHHVLGPHLDEEEGSLVIRAFRPDAEEVLLVPEGGAERAPLPLQRIHKGGIFALVLPGKKAIFPYMLEVRTRAGSSLVRDAYAFPPALGDLDLHLAAEGKHLEIYRQLGAHVREVDGVRGTAFAVWAPSARRVSVAGDFNAWDGRLHAMRRMGRGIWEIFIPGVGDGALYKFDVKTMHGASIMKADPYGQAMELRPNTASKVTTSRYRFTDGAWMAARKANKPAEKPLSIYEVHLGSWKIHPKKQAPGKDPAKADPAERWLTYRELAEQLVDYVADLGFTHIELLPVMEHPYDGSWGYQVTGYFAPTSRYGTPDDFRYFVDRCHEKGIGVILDWTPAHFPKDAFALGRFDGSALYEHLDPRQGEHKHWNTFVFNYGRPEVKNFLISNALYWIEEFHVDGLRVDAVASMLYLDYGASNPWEWVPNKFGGRENLEAVAFLRELCDAVHEKAPGVMIAAEESTSWPGVTRPTYLGGLGFDFKWNMGWMHDTLAYFSFDPIHRAFHHGKVTFGLMYAFSERFLLPFSHDEVVHLKRSLLSKMPGDRWKMHSNLRALYAYMWAHPGKKLVFMGGEIGQYTEWSFESELDWGLLAEPDHQGLQKVVRDLNALYKKTPALFELDDSWQGFQWIDANDSPQSVASFIRFSIEEAALNQQDAIRQGAIRAKKDAEAKLAASKTSEPSETSATAVIEPAPVIEATAEVAIEIPKPVRKKGIHLVFVGNFTPIPRFGYRIGVPRRSAYLEVLNTDARTYGGSGLGNLGRVEIEDVPCHGFAQSIRLTLPPLAALYLVPELGEDPAIEADEVEPNAAEAEVDSEALMMELEMSTMVSGLPIDVSALVGKKGKGA
ncbi:MAG: 1,4-alpha-glucan branching protein GlgB [Byssovorax sp.]